VVVGRDYFYLTNWIKKMTKNVVLKEKNNNGILTLSFNRPDKLNSYNEYLMTSFRNGLSEAEADPAVRLIVVRGAGKHFSAGADISWFKELSAAPHAEQVRAARLGADTMRKLNTLTKPSIALVHNACFGGATGFVAACDVAIASEDSRFAVTEVRLGITPAPILSLLVDAMGARQARRYALTGETFGAEEALRIGFVHKICSVGGLDEAVEPIFEGMLKGAPGAIADTKHLISTVAHKEYDVNLAEKMAVKSADGRTTEEGIEGFTAFLEKRKPAWAPD